MKPVLCKDNCTEEITEEETQKHFDTFFYLDANPLDQFYRDVQYTRNVS